jgi:hypothetical protein
MLIESKSLLAKLMATENLVVEQRNVSTAMFDTVSRVLIVPILDNKIPSHTYDLFIGHEVGHALWTPTDGQKIREKFDIPHSLANLVEDSRIERKIKYKYPGLKNSFIKGYKDLLDRNFFETKGVNINKMKFIDRLNLHCKSGVLLNIQFSNKELNLVREVESTETYEDVMVVCQKIIDFTKENLANDDLTEFSFSDFENDEKEVSDLIMDNDKGENEKSDEDGQTDHNENVEDDFKGTDEVSSESEYDDSENGINDDVSDLLDSVTNRAYKNNEYKLFSEESIDFIYVNVPKLTPDQTVIDFKDVFEYYDTYKSKISYINTGNMYDVDGFNKIRNEIKSGVSYLVKEFEMRKSADQLKKAIPAKTGDLNLNKIYSHQFNEDIFKKITVMPGAKSHGLVIFLDWSGSMISHLQNTVKQLFNIVMFCKKVNIPYEVYTFTNPGSRDIEFRQRRIDGDLFFEDVKLLNILSSRMNAAQFTKASSALVYMSSTDPQYSYNQKIIPEWFNMNGTPLNHTIVSAMEIVPAFQRKNNLQIVNTIFLTDGEGDSGLNRIYTDSNFNIQKIHTWNHSSRNPTHVVIRDPVTKHQEKIDFSTSRTVTASFIKLFKYRTNCNIVGFYILSPNEFKNYINKQFIGKGIDTQDIRANFSKNHCAVIKNDGFDEYYLLRSKKGDSDEPELVVKENASAKVLATAFAKYNTKRNTHRIVLNRFINIIA